MGSGSGVRRPPQCCRLLKWSWSTAAQLQRRTRSSTAAKKRATVFCRISNIPLKLYVIIALSIIIIRSSFVCLFVCLPPDWSVCSCLTSHFQSVWIICWKGNESHCFHRHLKKNNKKKNPFTYTVSEISWDWACSIKATPATIIMPTHPSRAFDKQSDLRQPDWWHQHKDWHQLLWWYPSCLHWFVCLPKAKTTFHPQLTSVLVTNVGTGIIILFLSGSFAFF